MATTVVSQPRVGFGVMLRKDGKILLGKRHDDAKKADSELHGEGTWTMPGGKLHFKEPLADGAVREMLEETGINIDKKDLELVSVADDIAHDAHFITIGFLCERFAGEPRVMEPDEITEWRWFPINSLPSRVFPPSEKVLENCLGKCIYRS
jgi:8-oxo-dGTP diphosphatase